MASGWAGSTRRDRLPADWPLIRLAVLQRDGYRCQAIHDGQQCRWNATDVDHINPNDDDDPANLRSLCNWHHKRKTATQANATRWQPAAAHTSRRPEPHPGLLP